MTLAEYLTKHLSTPFKWGEHDCVTFANNWVKEARGVDHLLGEGSWSDGRAAKRRIKSVGGLEAAISRRLNKIDPHFAHDGDIALCDGRVCIFSGSKVVSPGYSGLVYTDRMLATCAWSY